MRTVSFVDHIDYEYQGNLFSKAIALGDVDNDEGNELVVGNVHGELAVYKGTESKPWKRCTGLGMITCLSIGDVCNQGKNFVVTLSEEGWCHIITVESVNSNKDPSEKIQEEICLSVLKPVHRQHLAANNKVVLIGDIDSDGKIELLIGYSDRMVRAYRWVNVPDKDSCSSSAGQGSGLSGKLHLLEKWQLAGQIGSITLNKKADGTLDVMVSQPGGTFVSLVFSKHPTPEQSEGVPAPEGQRYIPAVPSVIYHPLGAPRARNPSVSTEVMGNISRRKRGEETDVPSSYYAACTLDGTITLLAGNDEIMWSLYVDHQLFELTKLDVTGDGTEEVVACSWDGQTYLVNLNKQVVRFQFPENVAAFCAGYFAVDGKRNVPCLIYATFNNSIHVFHNIFLEQIGCSNLLCQMDCMEGVQDLLSYLNVDASKPEEVRQLYHWCLYGRHPHTPNS